MKEPGTTKDRSEVAALAFAVRRLLEDAASEVATAFLRDWPAHPRWRDTAPRPLRVLEWLGPACRAGWAGAAGLLATLETAHPRLAWRQSYGPEDFGADFLERYGWTELIGARGPIMSDRIAVGLLLLGPALTYPPHSHDAEEVYLPLSGRAAWRRAAEP